VAKRTGKSRTQVFEPTMHAAAVRRLELNQDMRRAAEVEEFIVHYQPLVRLREEAVIGLEALIRWDHPRRGVVAPADFIALAEETGQIVKIGRMVLDRACTDLKRWQQTEVGGSSLSVSVNVSARQLIDDSFVDSVAAALGAASLDPSSLVLEITESVVMSDIDGAIERLHAVKALGVRLAIDDFGTGYSSLGYLRRLPVDVLKVDRSLIAGVDEDDQALALAEMIVHLGRTLRLETVAEGVERLRQAIALRRIGFDVAQGYHYSKAVPAEGVADMLTAMSRRAAAEARPTARRLTAAT
jgi:EAL domain-containing protein (putative c-di-GMP-specific phosphodiesterase class I)